MLPGLTIVVSPLISLMQDQMKKLPLELPGACFSGGLSAYQVSDNRLSRISDNMMEVMMIVLVVMMVIVVKMTVKVIMILMV